MSVSPEHDPWAVGQEEKDVARRRDELLRAARRNAETPSASSAGTGNAASSSAGTGSAASASAGTGKSASAVAGMGLQFVVVILICLYAGMWLDGKFGTGPWLLIVGVFVGASAGFYSMYRVISANASGKK